MVFGLFGVALMLGGLSVFARFAPGLVRGVFWTIVGCLIMVLIIWLAYHVAPTLLVRVALLHGLIVG